MPRRPIVDPRFPARLRELREERGLSLRALARRALSSSSHIHQFEKGEKSPTVEKARQLDDALQAGGELAALVHFPSAYDTPPPEPTVARRTVGADDIDAVREFTRTFRALDNRFGGGHAHSLAVQYLDTGVAVMLREGRYTDVVGRELFGAAAQLAHLAAWTAYDIGAHKRAQHLFGRALELASAAGDTAFGGEILAARGHHAVHIGDPATAVELARASAQAARVVAVPALLSEACALEANAHALLRRGGDCRTALREAEAAFARTDAAEKPDWLGYFDDGYLAARFAHTFRDLGDKEQARRFALQAVAMSESLTRTRGFNRVLLATTYVGDDLDAALVAGGEAVDAAGRLRSSRIVRYLGDLRRRLATRHRGDPRVAQFEEQLTATLGES